MRKVAEYFQTYPSLVDEMFGMLRNEGYNNLGYFFSNLSIDRMKANGFDTSKMANEIQFNNQNPDIASLVAGTFQRGKVYSKKDVKKILQEIYDSLGLKRTAKATDLPEYLECELCKKDGIKAIRIK
jgi:hypothetical protein